MKTALVVALAGAGLGWLLFTESGQTVCRQAREFGRDGLSSLTGDVDSRQLVVRAVRQPHPDTAMAQALEEAVTA